MQLILLERVEGLGNVGDEVTVRPGYGRNYLLPHGKAQLATEANRKVFERRREQLESKQRNALEQAQAVADKLKGLNLSISRATSDHEHLYGSVSTHELADLLVEHGFEVERRQVIVDESIKRVGEHNFRVRLHPDVTAELTLMVESENV
ncbi:MAG: 50S ribosomal protein L9 [Zetaproteobacteria bacterium CG06_land_8_20_14_3_00_59_53]|nr:MAG: 50S ribosomal protein L9 [Zetaproteobacteria bacterium CG2_30_59_37]PIO90715.1 MAG: 50S ribosomal protein L9 [Zetaproteobacteria bacterium CG23_combo_of_CG06-09_8_20_14_all_59_86]PIQ66181.1 MAG: 50S ribosomal protein L9 [Zetaproteobacteria bacterium CG11_big_fil_rev_8_21_14_0_20_59_439]PIU71638.1 MAG: 50S ribosomal protein L9 [Zetaproteobacteria bacterium CG06_land_8_20_14_3_00_59_53]PIU97834.1 MAG: 50S ribosomal protein L9 [Zetaproteobacteria bacterium CG03_land_8_20_14_0_80_59_51]PIY